MIVGGVSEYLEASTKVVVRGPLGEVSVAALIDTGYNGSLTLPNEVIAELGMRQIGCEAATLADGQEVIVAYFQGEIVWAERVVPARIDAADAESLLGTELLAGYSLRAGFVPGGMVEITRL